MFDVSPTLACAELLMRFLIVFFQKCCFLHPAFPKHKIFAVVNWFFKSLQLVQIYHRHLGVFSEKYPSFRFTATCLLGCTCWIEQWNVQSFGCCFWNTEPCFKFVDDSLPDLCGVFLALNHAFCPLIFSSTPLRLSQNSCTEIQITHSWTLYTNWMICNEFEFESR